MAHSRMAKASLLLLIVSTIGCDQVTKHVATNQLMSSPPHSFMRDTFRLVYSENSGGFLSLGSDLPPVARTAIFTVATGVILSLCVYIVFRRPEVGLSPTGLALVVGGGLSNLADRIGDGAVVDFMNIGVGSLRTGIFNFADVAITLGVGVLLIQWEAKREDGPDPAPPPTER